MPIVKFDTPKGSSSNKGSCSKMANYLCKEDEKKGLEKEFFFNHRKNMIRSDEVVSSIDNNRKGLAKNDAKFYSGSISFSQEELAHVNSNKELLKEYALSVFNEIAQNYNRDIAINDLNYFIKMETTRTFKGDSPEVKSGLAVKGDLKPGDNTHFHFIIGHKTVDGTKKVSPMTTHRNTQDGPITASFNRDALIEKCEKLFDQSFNYNRPLEQTYQHYKVLSKGTIAERSNQIESQVNVDTEFRLFMASNMKEKPNQIETKINEINQALSALGFLQPIDKEIILQNPVDSLNGRLFFELLQLQTKLPTIATNINLNQVIIGALDSKNKPFTDLPPKVQQHTLNTISQILNKELLTSLNLVPKDLLKGEKQIDHQLVADIITGAKPETQRIMNSLLNNPVIPNCEINPVFKAMTAEINKTVKAIPNKMGILLDSGFVTKMSHHFNDKEVKSALLSLKEAAKQPESYLIENQNLFFASFLIHSQKPFNEKPKFIRLEDIRKYAGFLNTQLIGKTKAHIDIPGLLKTEMENNVKGQIFAYLNKINSNIKKGDVQAVESLICTGPSQFIETSLAPHGKREPKMVTTPNDISDAPLLGNQQVSDLLSEVLESLSSVGFISPTYFQTNNNEDDEDEKLKRKKRKRKNNKLSM